jgi:hypothetical protein
VRLRSFLLGIAAIIVFSSTAMATTYFVSPTGNDANPGYFPFWAWRTVAHVNSAGLRSGDQVLFQRGGTWRETLIPQTNNLSYGAFGIGLRPVISGADLLSAGWSNVGANIWSYPLPSYPPTQIWLNMVRGTTVSSLASVLAPGQWFYGSGKLYIYSSGNPSIAYANPGVEVTQRDQPLLIQNAGNLTFCELAFVNGAFTNIYLAANVTGYQVFQGVLSQGALFHGLRVDSGSPQISASNFLYNGTGIGIGGGGGFSMDNSLLSGNRNNALEIDAATGQSYVSNSTISGNGTDTPYVPTISNFSTNQLKIGTSVLLPNPFDPLQHPFIGVTDLGTNAYQSPLIAARATAGFVVPFIDDYNNLGVAEAVSAVAHKYGFNISYALNTKLVTPTDWKRIAALQAAGDEIVAHTRSHSDLANNLVFSIQYVGTSSTAQMTINATAGTLQTFLNGKSTPDLNISISDPFGSIANLCASVAANPAYTCVIQPNQDFFTPSVLANVSLVNIKTSYVASASPGYLTFEVEGSRSDIQANLPGYKVTSFATPFTSSNATVENHIRDAGFSINRNGSVNSSFTLNGNWLFSNLDIYNIGSEFIPDQFDTKKPAASIGALVEGLGAAGGVMAIYSHGYDQFTLAQWDQFFSTMKSIGGSGLTLSQASAYIHSHGTLVPDGTSKNWVQTVVLAPNYAKTPLSPPQGAQDFQFVWPLLGAQNGFESQAPLLGAIEFLLHFL